MRFHLSDLLLANAVVAAFLAELTYAATRPGTDQWPVVLTSGLAAALHSGAAVWLAGAGRGWRFARSCLRWPWPSETTHFVDVGRRARFGLLVTEFALREYILEHGRSPETLAELVPRYLAAIPGDPFSGHPLVYRQRGNGYLLYSVGANGIDDGGAAAEWSEMLQGHGDLLLDDPAAKPAKSETSDREPDGEH